MSLGSFLSREWKLLEIEGLKYAVGKLALAVPALEGLIAAEASPTVQTVVTAVESADGKVLGPMVSGIINTALNAYEADIAPELEAVVAQGGPSLAANLVTAVNQTIAKLETEVEPVTTTHGVDTTATAVAEAPAPEPEPEKAAAPTPESDGKVEDAEAKASAPPEAT